MGAFAFSAHILDVQRPMRLMKSTFISRIWLDKSSKKAYACKAVPSSCKDVTGTFSCSASAKRWALTMTVLELLVFLMAAVLVGRITSVSVFLDCKGTRIFFLHDTVRRLLSVSIQLASTYITYFFKKKKLYWAQSLEVT